MTLDDLLGAIQSFDKNFNYRDFSGQDMRGLNDGLEGLGVDVLSLSFIGANFNGAK